MSDKSKTVVVLEQVNSYADEVSGHDVPSGYQVRETREENCDHPNTDMRVKNEDGKEVVVESCSVCNKSAEHDIEREL